MCLSQFRCVTLCHSVSIVTHHVFTIQSKDNTYKGHNDSVDQLCWHPSQPHLLVTASVDKTIRIWDIRSTFTHNLTKHFTLKYFLRFIYTCNQICDNPQCLYKKWSLCIVITYTSAVLTQQKLPHICINSWTIF